MKRTITLLVVLVSALNIFAQQDSVFIKHSEDWTADTLTYVTDTVVFPSGMVRHILTGTTIMPWTHNQQIAKGYGLYFKKVTKSDCQDHQGKRATDRINSIVVTDTTLTVDITISDNCCYDFLCDVSVDTNGVVNLIHYGYGTYCSCDCCFGLTYHFEKISVTDYPEIEAVMLNDDRETIRKIK